MSETVRVEVRGLRLRTHHGITEEEQREGQELILDVVVEVPECGALESDRIEETVDYADVARLVAEVATERSYRTLERLCRVIAQRVAGRFGAQRLTVRAAKPDPPLQATLREVAAEVEWEA